MTLEPYQIEHDRGSLEPGREVREQLKPLASQRGFQLLRARSYSIDVIADPTNVDPDVAAIGPTQARKRLHERQERSSAPAQYADAPCAVALRVGAGEF